MRALRAFFGSLGSRNLKLSVYGWAANLAFAVLLHFGLQRLMWLRAGRSLEGGDPGLRGLFTFLTDLLQPGDSGPALLLTLAGFFLLGFVAVTIFLQAGIYAVLVHNERSSFINLFNASLENFGRFLMLALVSLLAWVPAALLSLLSLTAVLRVDGRLHNEALLAAMLWGWAALTLILAGLASAVADYGKIFRLRTERNCLVSFWNGLRFVARYAGTILLLLLLYLLAMLLLNGSFWLLFGSWERLAGMPFGLLLLPLQALVLLKYYVKVTLVRAQVHLLQQPG